MSIAPQPKQRKSFTDLERQRLRLYHHSFPSLTPSQLASWFENHLGKKVSNSSIYDILSEKYAYLDNAEATDNVRKKKGPQWAGLEAALFRWWQAVQPREVTGRELKLKANEIWQSSPACQGKKTPSFSDGWLSNWRVRYGLVRSATATDVKQASFEVERSDGPQYMSGTWSLCISGNISAQSSSRTIPRCSPSSPLQGKLNSAHMTLQHSTNQTILDCQAARTTVPKMEVCSASVLPEQHTASFRISESQVKEHRIPQYRRLNASPSLDAANASRHVIRSDFSENTTPFHVTPWYGIQELFLKYKSSAGRDQILPGKIVLEVLEPILSSLGFSVRNPFDTPQSAYSLIDSKQHEVDASNARKVACLLAISDCFRLRQTEVELEPVIYEDWFLDSMTTEVLRSTSPGFAAIEDQPSSSSASNGVHTFRRKGNLQCTTSNAFFTTNGGRMNIRMRTFTNADIADNTQVIENFQASIAITPPANAHTVPQTIVHLGMEKSNFTSILSLPSIEFRNIRPEDSVVFNVAKYGSSRDLQLILSSGEASLSDCDPNGRSLINYALTGHNASTLKFLLASVNDIDTFEVDQYYNQHPLNSLLGGLTGLTAICQLEKKLICLKLMLEAGVNPSISGGPDHYLKVALYYGTAAVMKVILDHDQSCISRNRTYNSSSSESPLLYIATIYRNLPLYSENTHEKFFLLLGRGADIASRNELGESCLQIILQHRANRLDFLEYRAGQYKDILMCMVTAGADVYASDLNGRTVSQTACEYGNEELWVEVLAECGYDPNEVFSLEDEFCYVNSLKYPGMGGLAGAPPYVRSSKLSFKEYGRQRQTLDFVKSVHSFGEVDFWAAYSERNSLWDTYIEINNTDDYEWVEEIAKLKIPEGHPKLLHNGVPWQVAFS